MNKKQKLWMYWELGVQEVFVSTSVVQISVQPKLRVVVPT